MFSPDNIIFMFGMVLVGAIIFAVSVYREEKRRENKYYTEMLKLLQERRACKYKPHKKYRVVEKA